VVYWGIIKGQIDEAIAAGKLDPNSPRSVETRKADVNLIEQHPGEYVAYHDVWEGDNLGRIVIASGTTQSEMWAALNDPSNQLRQSDLQVHYRLVQPLQTAA